MNSEWGPLGLIGVLALSESKFENVSISYYKESIALQYPMYITMRYKVFEPMTYYPLYADSPWTGICNIIR